MSLLKLLFIFINVIGMRITATPPNPPLPFSKHIIPNWRERFLKSLAWPCGLLRAMYWSACLIEGLVILASQYPSAPFAGSIIETFISPPACNQQIQITPLFLLGISVTVFGTALRMKCYQTLGHLFTFELCIQTDHTLIVTGPYAVLRHPSYTGLILTIVGACCMQANGSWVKECGFLDTLFGRFLVSVWLTIAAAVVVSLVLRIPNEDALLHAKFGAKWELWSLRVRYKLIPGVY